MAVALNKKNQVHCLLRLLGFVYAPSPGKQFAVGKYTLSAA